MIPSTDDDAISLTSFDSSFSIFLSGVSTNSSAFFMMAFMSDELFGRFGNEFLSFVISAIFVSPPWTISSKNFLILRTTKITLFLVLVPISGYGSGALSEISFSDFFFVLFDVNN